MEAMVFSIYLNMKQALILFIFILVTLQAYASSPAADPALLKVDKIKEETFNNGDKMITLKVGELGKGKILRKIKDLSTLENLTYVIQEVENSEGLFLKITFKNGLLLDEAINKVTSQIP